MTLDNQAFYLYFCENLLDWIFVKYPTRCSACKHNLSRHPHLDRALISWMKDFDLPLCQRHEIQARICLLAGCGVEDGRCLKGA